MTPIPTSGERRFPSTVTPVGRGVGGRRGGPDESLTTPRRVTVGATAAMAGVAFTATSSVTGRGGGRCPGDAVLTGVEDASIDGSRSTEELRLFVRESPAVRQTPLWFDWVDELPADQRPAVDTLAG